MQVVVGSYMKNVVVLSGDAKEGADFGVVVVRDAEHRVKEGLPGSVNGEHTVTDRELGEGDLGAVHEADGRGGREAASLTSVRITAGRGHDGDGGVVSRKGDSVATASSTASRSVDSEGDGRHSGGAGSHERAGCDEVTRRCHGHLGGRVARDAKVLAAAFISTGATTFKLPSGNEWDSLVDWEGSSRAVDANAIR